MPPKIRVSKFEALQLGFLHGWFLASAPATFLLILAHLSNRNVSWTMVIYCACSCLIARTGYNLLVCKAIKRHVENRHKLLNP